MEWRSEAAHDHSRVLAQCFAGSVQGSGAAALTVQLENELWQKASSWKGYCRTLARKAASLDHESCMRVLHELGGDAAASLVAARVDGDTPAHSAAFEGHEGCLRVLHELGGDSAASLVAARTNGETPAHLAARAGHEPCLRVLHELGGGAAASLAAASADGLTPAHLAAAKGHESCLRVLHELLCMMIDSQLAMLAGSFAGTARDGLIQELRARRSLAWTQGTKPFDHVGMTRQPSLFSAAAMAAAGGHTDCFRFIAEIGGAAGFLQSLRDRVSVIDSMFPCLLTDPALLDLETKRGWLNWQLSCKVQDVGSDADVNLIVRRDDMLQGLCDALGVHETTGQVNAQAGSVNVTFGGEAAEGDGVRREWFGQTIKEIIDPNRGLFKSLDGGRTLQPNPESGDHAADHLAHFALLGRIAGMALHHCESLDVSWSAAFLKAVLGYPITVDDMASVDPEKCDNLRKMRGYSAEVLQAADLTFALDTEMGQQDFVVDANKRRRVSIELKPDGANIEVTPDNLEEYLQLYAEHHLIGTIREQVNAVRQGLGVFLDDALRAKLRACCTVAAFQLMLCGAPEIDVDDWQASAEYSGGYSADSDQVKWFWAEVRGMTPEERGQLLFFCTGSARVPATGFANLMGYSGRQQRFSIERDDRGVERPPTAATCFNMLKLPPYTSAQTLAAKLRLTFWAEGFHEGAVAT